ncbi:hypothetical protein [Methanobrevibacter sp.]
MKVEDYFNKEKWEKWVNSVIENFNGIKENSKIGIAISSYPEYGILFTIAKENIKVEIKENNANHHININEMDMIFEIDPYDLDLVLVEGNFSNFRELINNRRIAMYSVSELTSLIDKGYSQFMANLGFYFKDSASPLS